MIPFNILKQAALFHGACGAGRTAIPGDALTTSSISEGLGACLGEWVYGGKGNHGCPVKKVNP